MPRQSRKPSGTGIHHVMMRGIRSSSARLLPTGRKNDMAYFTMLLRYIHQNPLKAGIVEKVKDYEYSIGANTKVR